jgi:hypothetical protein
LNPSAPSFTILWHGPSDANGTPIVSGGRVWVLTTPFGSGGGTKLYGLDPATGAAQVTETLPTPVADHFASPSAAGGRLFVSSRSSVIAYQIAQLTPEAEQPPPLTGPTGPTGPTVPTGPPAGATTGTTPPGGTLPVGEPAPPTPAPGGTTGHPGETPPAPAETNAHPAGAPGAAPGTTLKTPAPEAARPRVELRERSLKLTRRDRVRVPLNCATSGLPCLGTLALRAKDTRVRGGGRTRTLAEGRFDAVGGAFALTLHLSATGRRLLRSDGVIHLTVAVTVDGVVNERLKASLRARRIGIRKG